MYSVSPRLRGGGRFYTCVSRPLLFLVIFPAHQRLWHWMYRLLQHHFVSLASITAPRC
ncbi:hypothetical protein BDV59DRAFT_169972 [Aspergillus ambiguus]|uniref:uncharacterized protein n=1 Tax=Aspergillus ambiguus TaxID=176160 RepID=UPI003CCE3FBF